MTSEWEAMTKSCGPTSEPSSTSSHLLFTHTTFFTPSLSIFSLRCASIPPEGSTAVTLLTRFAMGTVSLPVPAPTSSTVYSGFSSILAICLSVSSPHMVDPSNRLALLSQYPNSSSAPLRGEANLTTLHSSFQSTTGAMGILTLFFSPIFRYYYFR